MVLIEDLKNQILEGTFPSFIVFLCKKSPFIALHYIRQIADKQGRDIVFVDSESALRDNIFTCSEDPIIPVLICDSLTVPAAGINMRGYIICKEACVESLGDGNLCEVPDLQDWQLKDYLYSVCEGAAEADLDTLFNMFRDDPRQLELEMSKISIFPQEERATLLAKFLRDDIFGNKSDKTIFSLTNALCVKDITTVTSVLQDLPYIDVEPLGLVTLMSNNIRNILLIQGSTTATPEKTGLPVKQFYAISRIVGHYTTTQLVQILKMLDSIEYRLKTGELPNEWIISYVINYILSVQ